MNELKEAITYLLNTTKAKSSTELFSELIPLFYASAFSDGQQYMLDRLEKEDESLYIEGCLLKTGGYQPIGKDDDLPLNPPNTENSQQDN